jgi:hypothetical protein
LVPTPAARVPAGKITDAELIGPAHALVQRW